MPRLLVQVIAFSVPVVALPCAGPGAAQALRGDVHAAETNAPLPYSTIILQPGVVGRFANDSGAFSFPQLAAGNYRLVVRAIGYLPFDTIVTLTTDTLVLHVRLPPLAVELPPVTVVATRVCIRPGPPARDSQPELAAIFDQLRENAARYQLLSDAYPFRYWVERLETAHSPDPTGKTVLDTIELRSDARRPYKPGGWIINQPGPHGQVERTLRLPTVIDLADSIFHSAHCFDLAGIDSVEGRPHWRVDFLAADRLHSPDVAGSAWLDSASYQLRRLSFRLTHPEKAGTSLRTMEVTVAFGDLAPALIVPMQIVATSESKHGRRTVTTREEQRLLHVEFLKARPGSQAP